MERGNVYGIMLWVAVLAIGLCAPRSQNKPEMSVGAGPALCELRKIDVPRTSVNREEASCFLREHALLSACVYPKIARVRHGSVPEICRWPCPRCLP